MEITSTRSGIVPSDQEDQLPEQIETIISRVYLLLRPNVVDARQDRKCRQLLARLYAWQLKLRPPISDLEKQVIQAVFWLPVTAIVLVAHTAPSRHEALLDLETDTLSQQLDDGANLKFWRIIQAMYDASLERQLILDLRERLQACLGERFRDEHLMTLVNCALHACAWFYTIPPSEALSPFNPFLDLLLAGNLPLSMTEKGVVYVQVDADTVASPIAIAG